ncbi:hypothetical protein K1719_011145 [Acacia pycnantha]|nr:hypothetical protein K1719_041126 [Acacia pycnantha]KAI9117730.1 hypothetical protein K1719_011145 [Acacia pycnantha]
MALEIFYKVNYKLDEKQGLNVAADFAISELPSDHAGPSCVPPEEKNDMKSKKVQLLTADNVGLHQKLTEEKLKAKKLKENKEKLEDSIGKKKVVANKSEEKVAKEMISEAYTKEVIEGKFRDKKEEATTKRVKLVYGEDIRFATLEVNCSVQHLRQVISNRFPRLGGVLVKYKDEEGDLVTITSDEELRWAETSTGSESYMRLHIVDTYPENDPLLDCYPSFSF